MQTCIHAGVRCELIYHANFELSLFIFRGEIRLEPAHTHTLSLSLSLSRACTHTHMHTHTHIHIYTYVYIFRDAV